MLARKTYKIRAALGDGRPVDDLVIARSGLEAQDLAKIRHPGARTIHLLGIADVEPTVTHPFFQEPDTVVRVKDKEEADEERNRQIRWCLELKNQGKTNRNIAGVLCVSESTVRRWLKQYG